MTDLFDEDDIHRLVQSFYARVRQDELLAPIFATKIKDDAWDKHINHIASFWSSVLRKTGQFSGNPMQKHMNIHGLTPAHFTHWLDLFQNTAQRELSPEQADTVHTAAQRIAKSLQMGLAFNYEKSGYEDNPFREFGIRGRGLG